MKFTIAAIKNNYAPSMRGYTHYKFASIKDANGNYGPWIRLDKLPDVKFLSHAALRWNMTVKDTKGRHSCTNVEVDLPDETIIATADVINDKIKIAFVELIRDGKLTFNDIKLIEEKKKGERDINISIEVDGKRVVIPE